VSKDWDYGPDGRAVPVGEGELWAVGPHRYRCGSMMDPAVQGFADEATIVYADPPWNAGNLSSFYTKARKLKPAFSYLDVYARVLELAGDRPCFIEGGLREERAVRDLIDAAYYARFEITYFRKLPCVLHYAGPTRLPGWFDPSGLDDLDTPVAVMQLYETGVVLDPCCGQGLTSRCAAEAGWRSINNELHRNRMSSALAQMSRQLGRDPELVG
jgi:hypothetical protein